MAIRGVGKQYRQRNFREEGGRLTVSKHILIYLFIADSYDSPTILSLEGYSVDIVVIFTPCGAPFSLREINVMTMTGDKPVFSFLGFAPT